MNFPRICFYKKNIVFLFTTGYWADNMTLYDKGFPNFWDFKFPKYIYHFRISIYQEYCTRKLALTQCLGWKYTLFESTLHFGALLARGFNSCNSERLRDDIPLRNDKIWWVYQYRVQCSWYAQRALTTRFGWNCHVVRLVSMGGQSGES